MTRWMYFQVTALGVVGMICTVIFAKNVGLIHGEYITFLYHMLALVIASVFHSVVFVAIQIG